MSHTRFYETSTSGLNFDRFVDQFDESTLIKMRQQYWTAKQFIRTKLGRKEDEHLLASDAEFDAKLSLYKFVNETSEKMLCCVDDYQHYLAELLHSEFELSKMLKENGDNDKTAAGRVMIAVGRVLSLSAHYRLQMRAPLLRFFGELQVFTDRAILDCEETVDAAEKSRVEYRGSLLWIKKTSNELDPDSVGTLEKFRAAQNVVRKNKERLDDLKLDTLQKVDLLTASRFNLFAQLLDSYQKLLYNFYDQTSLAYEKIYDFVSEYKHYEFEILKDLIDPIKEESGNKKDAYDSKQEMDSERLIELEEKELAMVNILDDMENINGQNLENGRSFDSPLGQTDDNDNLGGDGFNAARDEIDPVGKNQNLTANKADSIQTQIGPLPTPKLVESDIVPLIEPPPGWHMKKNEKTLSEGFADLLKLDADFELPKQSLEAAWENLINSISSDSSEIQNAQAELFDVSTVSSDFPNPFQEPSFDVWNDFFKEFETGSGSHKLNEC